MNDVFDENGSFDAEASLTERQADGLRTAARTLNDLASLVQAGLPTYDPAVHEDDELRDRDITDTDTPFARKWNEIKTCIDTRLVSVALDESLDEGEFDHLIISGHPPENKNMTLSFRYTQQGALKTDIEQP
jgi:hypothetical protein